MSQPNPVSRRSTRWTGALARREALVLAALLASPLSALAEEDKDTSELRGLLQQLISRFGWSKPAEEPSQPTLFGEPVKARDDLSYTAESMLIRSLPVECPPLDVLTSELEKLYVLRDEDATDVDGYWGVLLASQTEATEAATAARPLFRLFFASSKVGIGMRSLETLDKTLAALDAPLRQKQRAAALDLQTAAMRQLVRIGNLAVSRFPYVACKTVQCDGLPRLLGRAEATVVISKRANGDAKPVQVRLTLMLDGYSCPIAAGNFVDLAQRGFYNGLPLSSSSAALPAALAYSILTSGQPAALGGNVTGFVDPRTGNYRLIPLEVFPLGGTEPVYAPEDESALAQRDTRNLPPLATPRSPFCAAGSLGMVHSPITYNDASSEFFITTHELPRDSPSGSRLLDGRYTLFGHVLEGVELLPTLAAGDMIQTITVTSGADLMQRPDPNPIYTRRSGKSQRDYQMLSGEGIEESLIPATVPLSKEEAASSQTGSDSTAQY